MDRPKWSGVYAATVLPFRDDFSIDEEGYRGLLRWLRDVDGISGILANGHTGEVTSLDREERRRVVEIAAEEMGEKPVIAAVQTEGTLEAIKQARDAREAGAGAVLVMPPHHWLRFGKDSGDVLRHFTGIAEAVDIDLIVHQYPFTGKACYSTKELMQLAEIPSVMAFKYGAREMARYELDYRLVKEHAPRIAFLNCIDEYLLPGLVLGADGVLVGCASFVPGLIIELVRAVERKDLAAAQAVEDRLFYAVRFIYGMGEPSGVAHQRMKEALALMDKIPSPVVRPPLETFGPEMRGRIKLEMKTLGLIS